MTVDLLSATKAGSGEAICTVTPIGSSVLDDEGGLVEEATFDLSPFRGSYCRVTVIDADGKRAWSNPIWS
jgi:hypothetical protein